MIALVAVEQTSRIYANKLIDLAKANDTTIKKNNKRSSTNYMQNSWAILCLQSRDELEALAIVLGL